MIIGIYFSFYQEVANDEDIKSTAGKNKTKSNNVNNTAQHPNTKHSQAFLTSLPPTTTTNTATTTTTTTTTTSVNNGEMIEK